MDRQQVLDTFDAHVLDATQAGVRSPVGGVVSRMLEGEHITLAHAWALARLRQQQRDAEWAEGCSAERRKESAVGIYPDSQ